MGSGCPSFSPTVWCARCKRLHSGKRVDLQTIIDEAAKKLADTIDAAAIAKYYEGK